MPKRDCWQKSPNSSPPKQKVVGLAETVLKAQAPLAAILESKMAASTLPVAI